MHQILGKLRGGDLRSVGRSEEVVNDVLRTPNLFTGVFDGMTAGDPIVRARAADAVEKISRKRPDILQPFKGRLMGQVAGVSQQEVRWHIAQMFSYLQLTSREREVAAGLLFTWVEGEKSRIVKVACVQTLCDFAKAEPSIRAGVLPKLRGIAKYGSPAMKARSKRLIRELS